MARSEGVSVKTLLTALLIDVNKSDKPAPTAHETRDRHLVKLMEEIPEVFQDFGGHHMSGGFTIKDEGIHTFSESMQKAYASLGEAASIQEPLIVDLELTLDDFTYSLLQAQRQCAPFGCDNPKPLYLLRNVTPISVSVFGKTKEHTKITFDTKGIAKEAIAFFRTPGQFAVVPTAEGKYSLLVHLEESFFMGRMQTRLRIVDII
jgi:single-stranded-DNA-specific exonuclease